MRYGLEDWMLFLIALTIMSVFGLVMFAGEIFWELFKEKWDSYARRKYNERHNKETKESMET